MKATYSNLMNSKYFNPAFNSAIFDGPVRIYFAQFHESLALKIYFSLQQQHAETLLRAKEFHRKTGQNCLLMLYPSSDAFRMSFVDFPNCAQQFIVQESLGEDALIGINGPFEDHRLPEVITTVVDLLRAWAQEDGLLSIPEIEVPYEPTPQL